MELKIIFTCTANVDVIDFKYSCSLSNVNIYRKNIDKTKK